MAQKVRELMTAEPVTLNPAHSLVTAAQAMREQGIGAILVVDQGELKGLVTDRDIVVRAIADGKDPGSTSVAEVCSAELVTVAPDDDADQAVRRMREAGVRRIPVVENGRSVGVLSLGDAAIERDERSALADISAKRSNT
jgi:CBS domain-containing protein